MVSTHTTYTYAYKKTCWKMYLKRIKITRKDTPTYSYMNLWTEFSLIFFHPFFGIQFSHLIFLEFFFWTEKEKKNTAINRPQHEIFILTSEWPCQCPYIGVCAFDLFYIYAVVSQLKSIKHILNWNKTLHFDMFVDISIDINIDTLKRQFVWRLCVRKEKTHKQVQKFEYLRL